mgnify:CR=1 FL=1
MFQKIYEKYYRILTNGKTPLDDNQVNRILNVLFYLETRRSVKCVRVLQKQ